MSIVLTGCCAASSPLLQVHSIVRSICHDGCTLTVYTGFHRWSQRKSSMRWLMTTCIFLHFVLFLMLQVGRHGSLSIEQHVMVEVPRFGKALRFSSGIRCETRVQLHVLFRAAFSPHFAVSISAPFVVGSSKKQLPSSISRTLCHGDCCKCA